MNKVILCGRLVRDPEVKTTQGGKTYCKFVVACDRAKKDAGADFLPCIAWDRTAELIGNYFGKGRRILLEGRIQTGSYEAKDGTKRHTTDIMVDRVEFVESKSKESVAEQGGLPFVAVDNGADIPF